MKIWEDCAFHGRWLLRTLSYSLPHYTYEQTQVRTIWPYVHSPDFHTSMTFFGVLNCANHWLDILKNAVKGIRLFGSCAPKWMQTVHKKAYKKELRMSRSGKESGRCGVRNYIVHGWKTRFFGFFQTFLQRLKAKMVKWKSLRHFLWKCD